MIFKSKNKELETITTDKISTLIGEDCIIEGSITSNNYIKIDGKVLNDINVKSGIILGEKGQISGNINTGEMIIFGNIKGNIKANKLHLKSTAHITGDIDVESLQIDFGSIYKGNISVRENQKDSLNNLSKENKEEKKIAKNN